MHDIDDVKFIHSTPTIERHLCSESDDQPKYRKNHRCIVVPPSKRPHRSVLATIIGLICAWPVIALLGIIIAIVLLFICISAILI